MKQILFISASLLDANLMRLACEALPQKIRLVHVTPDSIKAGKRKASYNLIIVNHCPGDPAGTAELAGLFSGPVIHLADKESHTRGKNCFTKPFDEETLEKLLVKFLKRKRS